jgi:hypothetical protein
MEQHRANPVCASCHRVLDPLGFALENFDAVGAWRTRDGGQPVDVSGQLADGTPVHGAAGLRQALLDKPDLLVTTLTEKLMTYGVGRGVGHADMPAVRAIVRASASNDYRFSSLILGIVGSKPFQMRMKAPESKASEASPSTGEVGESHCGSASLAQCFLPALRAGVNAEQPGKRASN